MIPLETLQHSSFEPLVGQSFTVMAQEELALTLHGVRLLGHKYPGASRDPFSIAFRGPQGLRLPQSVYHISHAAIGEMQIFITQTADSPQGSEFEAVFT